MKFTRSSSHLPILCAMVRIVSLILFLFCSFQSKAQSTDEVSREAVITQARKQLVAMSAPDGELATYCIKNNVSGDFVVDLTLGFKGRVLTVFMVSSNPENVQNQNSLKSKLTDLHFEDIRISKKDRIKFRHTLTFNP